MSEAHGEIGVPVEIDGMSVTFGAALMDVGDILRLAGRDPAGDNVLVNVADGYARLVAPGVAAVPLDGWRINRFRTFEGGRVHRLVVDGRAWAWGAATIAVADVLDVAGAEDGAELVMARGTGVALDPAGAIALAGPASPEFEVRMPGRALAPLASPAPAPVPITVNGLPREWAEPELTFDQLVRLAHPDLQPDERRDRALTVVFRGGPVERPEGTLAAHQAIRAEPGTTFHVIATDKG